MGRPIIIWFGWFYKNHLGWYDKDGKYYDNGALYNNPDILNVLIQAFSYLDRSKESNVYC